MLAHGIARNATKREGCRSSCSITYGTTRNTSKRARLQGTLRNVKGFGSCGITVNTTCSPTGNTKHERFSSSCSATCSTAGNTTKREACSSSCNTTCGTTRFRVQGSRFTKQNPVFGGIRIHWYGIYRVQGFVGIGSPKKSSRFWFISQIQ